MVDHHRKKTVMQGSAVVSLGSTRWRSPSSADAGGALPRPGQRALWVFVVLLMLGVIAGNLRSIALPTLVTLLIPEDRRDKANGLVGTVDRRRRSWSPR